MGGWKEGWKGGKAGLRIDYSNKKLDKRDHMRVVHIKKNMYRLLTIFLIFTSWLGLFFCA